MPIDDFATVGQVYELDDRVRTLEGKPPRVPLSMEAPPEAPEAPAAAPAAQEGPETA